MLFTKEAESIVRAHPKDGTPLFLYLAHQAVHVGNQMDAQHPEYWPDQAPARYIDQYAWVNDSARRNLSAMVTVLDESVGNLTQTLKDSGMWDNTLLVFSTDNGGPIGECAASNYPLKMGKGSCWEGGLRGVGFVAGGPNSGLVKTGGYLNRALIHITDWLPTFCEVAGCLGMLNPSGDKPIDGFSAWAAISNNGTTQRTEIMHDTEESNYSPAIRVGDYKLLNSLSKNKNLNNSAPVWALYNVVADPSETTDLAASMPDKVAAMAARIAYYNKTSVPPCDRLAPDPQSNPLLHGGVWTPWSNDTGTGCPAATQH